MQIVSVILIVGIALWYSLGKTIVHFLWPYMPLSWQKRFKKIAPKQSGCGGCNSCHVAKNCGTPHDSTIHFIK